jgi:hypothetical protein
MIRTIAASLLLASLLGACTTTSTTSTATSATGRTRLRDLNAERVASNSASLNEPPPPAEGPEDVPAEGPGEIARNPGLVPTPLLRGNAAANP